MRRSRLAATCRRVRPVAWAGWTSTGCCSPSPGASAPGSRWRSRRWRGWCAPSSRPSTATTRSSTTSSSSTASSDLGVVFVDDIAEVPAGRPIMLSAHGSAPEVVAAARATRRLRRRRGVPARHQGPPRGEGPGRQGLPHRLRRPRGPRGGRRHDGRRARARSAGSRPSPRSRRCPTSTEPVALLAQTTLSHRDWAGVADAARSGSPTSGRRAAATCASPPPTASRRCMAIAPRCDAIVVIGSANSSNTRALEKLAREAGCRAGVPRQRRRRAARRPDAARSASPPARRRPRSSSRP